MTIRKGFLGLLLSLCVSQIAAQQAATDTICITQSTSHFAVSHQAGMHYLWNVQGGVIVSKTDSSDITVQWNQVPGFYKVGLTIVNQYNCPSDTSEIMIFIGGGININGPIQVCKGSLVTLEVNQALRHKWQGGKNDPTISFTAQNDTSLFAVGINNPCANDTVFHTVEVVDPPTTSMSKLEDTIQLNSSVRLFYLGQAAQTVLWFVNGVPQASGREMLRQFKTTGTFEVCQVVMDGTCSDSLCKTVVVVDEFKVFIPNVFSPNGDGINDVFLFKGIGIRNYNAVIYDRWGAQIYQWDNNRELEGWDGFYRGEPAQVEAYIYKIEVWDNKGKKHDFTSSFSLIR